jgi:peptidyl-prolyl cis-trans isomerase C
VLAYQGEAVLTQATIDAAFSRIPEQDRLAFIRDGAKVDTMVKSLLQTELVALDADANEFFKDPAVRARLELAARIELATAWMEGVLRKAPEADYLAMAREEYLVNPGAYSSPATVDVTHILISTKARLPSEAEAIALDLQARLRKNPAEFDALVQQYSEDPSKTTNAGAFKEVKHGQLVKPFEDAAFGMATVGQITGPIETEYGFHLIRLDGKHESVLVPFAKVQNDIVEKMKAKHLADFRVSYLQKLLHSPVVFPEGSVEIMAKRHFGENLEAAPVFSEEEVETGSPE